MLRCETQRRKCRCSFSSAYSDDFEITDFWFMNQHTQNNVLWTFTPCSTTFPSPQKYWTLNHTLETKHSYWKYGHHFLPKSPNKGNVQCKIQEDQLSNSHHHDHHEACLTKSASPLPERVLSKVRYFTSSLSF